MATTSSPLPTRPDTEPREVRIYSHSALFYWWPVWVCGYLMAIWTAWDGHRLAIVPPHTTVARGEGDDFVLKTSGKISADEPLVKAVNDPTGFPQRVALNSRL